MLKNFIKSIALNILKKFANMGKMTTDKRPNLAMRLFIYLNGNNVYIIPDLSRICFASSVKSASHKFLKHQAIELNRIDTIRYLLSGDKIIDKVMDNWRKVTVEHHEGFGEDTMKITFSHSGTRIKLNTKKVSKETVSSLLELITYQDVSQTLRSQFVGISSVLKPNYNVKLFTSVKKAHWANYNATTNKITLVK